MTELTPEKVRVMQLEAENQRLREQVDELVRATAHLALAVPLPVVDVDIVDDPDAVAEDPWSGLPDGWYGQ